MVPTTSTSITLLLGDCLAVALMNKINFSKDRFKIFHPGGNIGQALLLAKDIMIKGTKIPISNLNKSIFEAIKIISLKKLGFVVILKNKLVKGILTDGDARRGIKYFSKEDKIEKFMTTNPKFISENTTAQKALSIMNERKISTLLVTSENEIRKKGNKKLLGIINIHSLLKYGIK